MINAEYDGAGYVIRMDAGTAGHITYALAAMAASKDANAGELAAVHSAWESAFYTNSDRRRDEHAWRQCGHRSDYASAAEHATQCPAHGTDR